MLQGESCSDSKNLRIRHLRQVYESKVVESYTSEDEKAYEICRGTEDSKDIKGKNYDGVYYRNSFKVGGGAIYLHKVGFFGPKKVESAIYSAEVIAEPSLFDYRKPSWWDTLFPCLPLKSTWDVRHSVRAKAKRDDYLASKGDIWWVTFPQPYRVPENNWTDILFRIQGTKETACMKQGQQLIHFTKQTEIGQRRFEFVAGSCQMPLIQFFVSGSGINNGRSTKL
ncbi:unnamed protein product [Allacma fusca]|uniref:Uncharacterized protein n=1 Tax=Allacma fusca TaxID=39272 RepID=A0A8J2KLL2_9HEXA|nr:unnamed protein product [Allacma fusca]